MSPPATDPPPSGSASRSAAHPSEVWLCRHGETEWSVTRRHTGRTDLELTPAGEIEGRTLRRGLDGVPFSRVFTSPLIRARRTCELAGFVGTVDPDLAEWDYGVYDGRTTADIRLEQPGWEIWTAAVPGGESLREVGERVDRVLARLEEVPGAVALFGHAHLFRVLAARWLGLPAIAGTCFALDTAAICVLGWERERRVIRRWNDRSHLDDGPA